MTRYLLGVLYKFMLAGRHPKFLKLRMSFQTAGPEGSAVLFKARCCYFTATTNKMATYSASTAMPII